MTKIDTVILGILIGGVLLIYLHKKIKNRSIQHKLNTVKRANRKVVNFLEDEGYSISSIQETKTIITWVDGKEYQNKVKASILVKKRGHTYLAIVKTGNTDTKLAIVDIRSQLMEYYLAFQPYGFLLVDVRKKQIEKIFLSVISEKRELSTFYMYGIIAIIGLLFGFILYKIIFGG
ncbi:MAG: hypothetical protein PHI90_11300 [Clostridia bacterium]|nr:hypothetical protein [Clostridia bacterium]